MADREVKLAEEDKADPGLHLVPMDAQVNDEITLFSPPSPNKVTVTTNTILYHNYGSKDSLLCFFMLSVLRKTIIIFTFKCAMLLNKIKYF